MRYTGSYKEDVKKKTRNTPKREEWMSKWESCVLEVRPDLRGRLDWAVASYQYSLGLTPADASFNAYGKDNHLTKGE